MVALFARGRALLASPWLAALLVTDPLSQSWTPEERAGALASGLFQIGAGHPEAVGLVKEALGKYPDLATILPPGFDGPDFLPPLTLAVGAGNGPLVSVLLEAGAEPNPRTGGAPGLGWTPLFVASREGHAGVVSTLMDVGGVHPADCVATGGVTALMAGSEHGHAGVVELLLSRAPELDVDARDERRGMAALHLAALHPDDGWDGAVISALVQQGKADPWAAVVAGPAQEWRWRKYVGYTPIHLAIAQGALTAAEALLRAVGPAVLTTPTATGLRPLHVAIEHGQQKSLEWLLQTLQAEGRAVAAVSDREERTGATPLIYAVRRSGSSGGGGVAMVETLLKVVSPAGLTREQDWNGLDGLHTATTLAAEDATDEAAAAMVRLLLMAGASPMERVGAHLPESSPICASCGLEEGSLSTSAPATRPLPHEGWTAQAQAVARGRMDLLALLSEGHPVADVALDAWAALAAKAARDEGLRLSALDYVVRGAVRHAGVVRALLGRAPSTAVLGNASTLFPDEVGLEPGASVTALDVACYEGQWDAAHALRPPRLADPRLSLHQHRQPRRWSPRLVSPLGMAVRGGHPELVRDLSALASTRPDRDLACGLRALAEAVLETASITAEAAEAEGSSCVARRRAARRREVLAVLEEELPCRPEMVVEEEEEEEMEAAPAEEERVVVEEDQLQQQNVTIEEEAVGPVVEEAHPQLVEEEKAETEQGTCAAPEVERPPMMRADVLLPLLLLLICAAAFHATVILLQILQHRRGAAAVPGQRPDAAAVESTQEESLVERASPSLVSEDETLSTPTSDEQPPLSPSADLVPAVPVGKEREGNEGQEEVDLEEEDEDDEEEEDNHLGLSAFTMGTLMMGPSRLPPEASWRLLEEMKASPEALRRLSSPLPPAPAPAAPAAPSDDSQPKALLSFAEEAGGEVGGGVEGQGASGGVQEELPVGEEAPQSAPAVQALGEALEAEKKEKEQGTPETQEQKC